MSCGPDQLPVILLEAFLHSLLDPFTNIVNAQRGSGVFLPGLLVNPVSSAKGQF